MVGLKPKSHFVESARPIILPHKAEVVGLKPNFRFAESARPNILRSKMF